MTAPSPARLADLFAHRSLSFVANAGQSDPSIQFQASAPGHSLLFGASRIDLLGFARAPRSRAMIADGDLPADALDGALGVLEGTERVTQVFPGARDGVTPVGDDQQPGVVNYFVGDDPSAWRSGVPTYGAVRYPGLYPGIDLVFGGPGGALKSEWLVAPGADPSLVRTRYEGDVEGVVIAADGSLRVTTALGAWIEAAPEVYQTIDGARMSVPASYTLDADGTVGFALGDYDAGRPLVIDPSFLYSTYLGGSSNEFVTSIRVDSTNAVYLAGVTQSTAFGAVNSSRPFGGGSTDAFVAKLNPAGNALVYLTFLGGTGDDQANAVRLRPNGVAFVAGTAQANFPTTPGASLGGFAGGLHDAFVTKLTASGGLSYSTYVGSASDDYGLGLVVDGNDQAVVVGRSTTPTTSGLTFPILHAAQPTFGGGSDDGFVAKLLASGGGFAWSTFLGGSGQDRVTAASIDSYGNIYVTGLTSSTSTGFPIKPNPGAFQTTGGGDTDAFATKYDASGSLVYSTLVGGNSSDNARSIGVDGNGNAIIVGITNSTNYPTKNALQSSFAGNVDAIVTKVNATGTGLVYSTYFGASGADYSDAVVFDTAGYAYITGGTEHPNAGPTAGAPQPTNNGGGGDAYVLTLDPSGAKSFFTYLGGTGLEEGDSLTIDTAGNVYVAGETRSSDFPTTAGTFQPSNPGGAQNGFVTRISAPIAAAAPVTPAAGGTASLQSSLQTNAGLVVPVQTTLQVPPGAVGLADNIQLSLAGMVSDNGAGLLDPNAVPLISQDGAGLLDPSGNPVISNDGGSLTSKVKFANPGIDAQLLSEHGAGDAAMAGRAAVAATAVFSAPVTLSQTYDPAAVAAAGVDPSTLVWTRYLSATNSLQLLPGNSVDTLNHRVTAQTTQTGAFQLINLPPPGLGNLKFVTPVRVVDTRGAGANGTGPIGLNGDGAPVTARAFTAGEVRRFKIGGATINGTAFPADVSGVMVNVTIVQNQPSGGFVTVFPGDVADANRPNASTVNPSTAIAANFWNTAVPTSGANAGTIAVYSTNVLDVLIDVVGYTALSNATSIGNLKFITPTRVLDTRSAAANGTGPIGFNADGTAVTARPFNQGELRRFGLAGRTISGTTFPADVSGIVAHVTIIGQPAGGFVTLLPGDAPSSPAPGTSTVNPSTGIAFNAWANGIPTAGANSGTFALFSTNQLDLAVDVVGYYAASNTTGAAGVVGGLTLVTPVRVLDTRGAADNGTGPIGHLPDGSAVAAGSFTPGSTRRFQLAGQPFAGGSLLVPANVKGVLLNVTIVGSPAGGFVTVFPGDVADANRPNASTVNPVTGVAASFWANGIPVSPATNPGTFAVFSTNQLDVIVDIVGYFR